MPASLLLCAVRAVLKFTQDESQVFQNQVLHKILTFSEIFQSVLLILWQN